MLSGDVKEEAIVTALAALGKGVVAVPCYYVAVLESGKEENIGDLIDVFVEVSLVVRVRAVQQSCPRHFTPLLLLHGRYYEPLLAPLHIQDFIGEVDIVVSLSCCLEQDSILGY